MESAKEVKSHSLPDASLATLQRLRNENCSADSKEFHLQSFQIFLRRLMSPESPQRSMMLFHGTGVGKTASAIQIAEEYIMRPEFQDKKVIVLAGKAVQGSFRNQIFDVSRAEDAGAQVTGRRYLELLQRAQKEKLRWEDAESREILTRTVKKIIDEFYQFEGYESFANRIERIQIQGGIQAVKKELENRLIIVDEAHNLRTGDVTSKLISAQIENVVKNVPGLTLVLMTATPMFDTYEDIMFYFNLFLWNDKRQRADERLMVSDFFNNDGTFVNSAADARFRGYAHEYTSFIRGENPFTFPFRLPPPDDLIAPADRKKDPSGKTIKKPRKFLPLVGSTLQSPQKEIVEKLTGAQRTEMIDTIVVPPNGIDRLGQCFTKSSNENRFVYKYAPDVPTFLAPSMVAKHSAKFKTVIDCIKEGTGVVFVYSNFREFGIEMFAAALEEHGYEPYSGPRMLENPSKETTPGSSGKYVYLTESNIDKTLVTLKSKKNVNGEVIKVILGSPFVAEGVDFRYIRQVHVLDPWYNISRIDQVIGRGLRTCSHSILDFKEQNCTVYLHICRIPDSDREAYDEFVYRNYVEEKAEAIARIKRVIQESAVDCSLQVMTNSLPQQWKDLLIQQVRSQDKKEITYKLSDLSGPSFEEGSSPLVCHPHPAKDVEGYVRPLSAYLDVKDEVFNLLLKIFKNKPIWSREDILEHPDMIADKEVVQFLLDEARETHLRLKDSKGREGTLESKEDMYAFKPLDMPEGATMLERVLTANEMEKSFIPIEHEKKEEEEKEEEEKEEEKKEERKEEKVSELDMLRKNYNWKYGLENFPDDVLNWYLLDTEWTKDDKKEKFLLSLFNTGDTSAAYIKDLIIEVKERDDQGRRTDKTINTFIALGPSKLFNKKGEAVTPVGYEKDDYNIWINDHIERFVTAVKDEGRVVCTMGKNKSKQSVIKFGAFSVQDGNIVREKREKTITAKECAFHLIPELTTLAKLLNPPNGFAEDVEKKDAMCVSLSVFSRNAHIQGNTTIYWVVPELMDILTSDTHKTTLRSKLK